MEEKGRIVKKINGGYTQGFSFGKYRVQQLSAHICDRGGGSVAAISFPAKKTTALSFHSSALHVFVFVGRQASGF